MLSMPAMIKVAIEQQFCPRYCPRRCKASTAEVLPSVSKVAGVWRGVFWCLESVMLWRGIMGLTKFGDKHVNDLDLL